MTGNLVASTPKASLQALAFQGIMVYNCFAQIRDMLQRKFGDAYVLLFARPAENLHTGLIDWYSPVQGQPQPVSALNEKDQASVYKKAADMAADIQAYAEELIHSPDQLKVTRGNILKLALSCPDKDYIYTIGQQPVFVCWGFGPGTPGVEPQDITRLISAVQPEPRPIEAPTVPTVPKTVPADAVRHTAPARKPLGRAWLWWLVPLLALCLLIIILFTSFGHLPALSGKTLFHGPELPFLARHPDKSAEIASLQQDIAEYDKQLRNHIAMCKPDQQRPYAQKPDMSQHEQELVIPKHAEDTSFLKGKWRCDTGLVNKKSGEPVAVEFYFAQDGTGSGAIYEKGDQCVGHARSAMHNGELLIQLDPQRCQNRNGGYSEVSIICKNAKGNTTECFGTNSDGSTWDASFKRIK